MSSAPTTSSTDRLLDQSTYDEVAQFVAHRGAICSFANNEVAFDSESFFRITPHLDRGNSGLSFTISRSPNDELVVHASKRRDYTHLQKVQSDSPALTFLLSIRLAVELGCKTIFLAGLSHNNTSDQALVKSLELLGEQLCNQEKRLLLVTNDENLDLNLTRIRSRCLIGDYRIAVTVRTFSNDSELVEKLKESTPHIKLNQQRDKMEGDRLVEFLSDADGAIIGMERPTREVLAKLPFLRVISKYGVGVDNIDFAAARDCRVPVNFKKGLNTDSVAELTLGFLIMLLRRVDASMNGYRSGKWNKTPGREICETTVGLIGYGIIGKVVAKKLLALGVKKVFVHDILPVQVEEPASKAELSYLLAESDVVSLHISMSPESFHLVDETFIARMKQGAYLINTSRGEVIDETALIQALQSGRLAGAALDVYEGEPVPDKRLIDAPNLITTCHIGGSSNRAIKNMGNAAIEGVLKELRFSRI